MKILKTWFFALATFIVALALHNILLAGSVETQLSPYAKFTEIAHDKCSGTNIQLSTKQSEFCQRIYSAESTNAHMQLDIYNSLIYKVWCKFSIDGILICKR